MSDPRAEAVRFLIAHQTAVDEARRNEDFAAEVQALVALGILRHLRGEQTQAFERLAEAQLLAEAHGDLALRCTAQLRMADVHAALIQFAPALGLYESVLKAAEEAQDAQARAGALYGLSHMMWLQGKIAQSRLFLQRAKLTGYSPHFLVRQLAEHAPKETQQMLLLELQQEVEQLHSQPVPDPLTEAALGSFRASVAFHLGRYDEALQLAQSTLTVALRTGNRVVECALITLLGEVRSRNALTRRESKSLYEQALRIAQECGLVAEAIVIKILVLAAEIQENYYVQNPVIYDDVYQRCTVLVGEAQTLGVRRIEAVTAASAGFAAQYVRAYDAAQQYLRQAADLYEMLGHNRQMRQSRRYAWLFRWGARWQRFAGRFRRGERTAR